MYHGVGAKEPPEKEFHSIQKLMRKGEQLF